MSWAGRGGHGPSWRGGGARSAWGRGGWGRPGYWAYGDPYGFLAFDAGLAFGLGLYPWYGDAYWSDGPVSYSYTDVIPSPPPYGYDDQAAGPPPADSRAAEPPAACGAWRWDTATSQYYWEPCAPGS